MTQANPTRSPGSILLLTGARAPLQQHMYHLIVQSALAGPVKLLVGANRYDHYGIIYALARLTGDYESILAENIRLSRAETCYQMVELLAQTEADEACTLAMDPLKTFYDEGVPEREVHQLLFESILHLRRLSKPAPLVVSAGPSAKRPYLYQALAKAADRIEQVPPAPAEETQRKSNLL
jgi:hypothetical protein